MNIANFINIGLLGRIKNAGPLCATHVTFQNPKLVWFTVLIVRVRCERRGVQPRLFGDLEPPLPKQDLDVFFGETS